MLFGKESAHIFRFSEDSIGTVIKHMRTVRRPKVFIVITTL